MLAGDRSAALAEADALESVALAVAAQNHLVAVFPDFAGGQSDRFAGGGHNASRKRVFQLSAAGSGASSPLSVAADASLRMADMRIMMDDDPRPRPSRDTRKVLTVALYGVAPESALTLSESQLPERIPMDFALFTRAMPTANSGASSPVFEVVSSSEITTTVPAGASMVGPWRLERQTSTVSR